MALAIFGIDGGALSTAMYLLVLFLIVVYLSLIYWTYLDARRRIEDPVLIACATAASLFPFVGTVIYTILRPPEFLEDREERELELRAAELRLRELIEHSCPHCEYPIERGYLRCPNCERRLRDPCRNCGKPLDPKWGICPYCETEARRPRPEREGRRTERERRRRAVSDRAAAGATGGRNEGAPRRKAPRPVGTGRSTGRSAEASSRSSGSGRSGSSTPSSSDSPGRSSSSSSRSKRPAGGSSEPPS